VQLHRTLAFTLAGFVAGVAGILNIWWNGQIDPTSINIGPTLDLLIIAVIGGIAHLEGAWLGAFVFVGANIYIRDIPLLGNIGGVIEERILAQERFNTMIGLMLLVIMLLSPDGLAGIIQRLRDAASKALRRGPEPAATEESSLRASGS
jgi:branched-chain amino acid transport system permease protein